MDDSALDHVSSFQQHQQFGGSLSFFHVQTVEEVSGFPFGQNTLGIFSITQPHVSLIDNFWEA